MAERSREASEAETLIAGEVERFHQKQLTVNVAPAIVALQRQAEDMRQAEMRRVQARLGGLTADQIAAVEALTRGLVNKFLHPPIQALKQAARDGNQVRLDTVCEEWSVSAVAERASSPVKDALKVPGIENLEIVESEPASAALSDGRAAAGLGKSPRENADSAAARAASLEIGR
jgi:hypothetical protein